MAWSDGHESAAPPQGLRFRTLARLAVAMRRTSADDGSGAPGDAAQARDRERARLLAADEEGATSGLY